MDVCPVEISHKIFEDAMDDVREITAGGNVSEKKMKLRRHLKQRRERQKERV